MEDFNITVLNNNAMNASIRDSITELTSKTEKLQNVPSEIGYQIDKLVANQVKAELERKDTMEKLEKIDKTIKAYEKYRFNQEQDMKNLTQEIINLRYEINRSKASPSAPSSSEDNRPLMDLKTGMITMSEMIKDLRHRQLREDNVNRLIDKLSGLESQIKEQDVTLTREPNTQYAALPLSNPNRFKYDQKPLLALPESNKNNQKPEKPKENNQKLEKPKENNIQTEK